VELLHGILLVSTVKVPTLLVSVLGRVESALIVNVWAISKVNALIGVIKLKTNTHSRSHLPVMKLMSVSETYE
jgi:hypothetical protein